MANDPLFIIVIISCAAVAIILMLGVGSFAKGGEFSRKHSNRLMRWRIGAQAVAIAVILLFIWMRSGG